MTPKETVQSAFESVITPVLEHEGFSYSRSQFAYKRKLGSDFVQHISISLSQRNSQDCVHFWSAFNVSSPSYAQWLKVRARKEVEGGKYIGGCADWNIPGWRRPGVDSTSFDFSDAALRPYVLSEWQRRCFAAGLPYLDSLSSWRGAAEDLIRWGWHYEKAADLFLIGGLKNEAIAALEAGIKKLDREVVPVSPAAHPVLVSKHKRESEERDWKRLSYQKRIEHLRTGEPDASKGGPTS